MPQFEARYNIARLGRATSFTEAEFPIHYCKEMKNRFINAAGGAEKRQGMVQKGTTISGAPNLTGLHEFIQKDGGQILFASGEGAIYKFDGTDWNQVHTGLDTSARLRHVQMGKKIIFYNGVDRNIQTEDGDTFQELRSVIVRGAAAGAVSAGGVDDADVSDWVNLTDVTQNDIVFNVTRNAYAVITAVTTAAVVHTTIGSAATGLGQVDDDQKEGDRYIIIDGVELNIIPTDDVFELDNVATAASGTDATTILVSGVNFADTDIKVGDFVRNTTRSALAQVSAVATALTVSSVAAQVSGDSLVFLQSALPITTEAHVHFSRLYLTDVREQAAIRISGVDAPEDFTTDAASLFANTLDSGAFQAEGDTVIAMASYQRFLGIAGRQNLYLFQGVDPIADTSADATSFDIVGLFPQGCVSPDGLLSIGNDLVWVTPDGVQSTSLVGDASTLNRANISEALKTTLRKELAATPEDQIQAIHYPKRAWYMLKVGSQIHIYNYTAYLGDAPYPASRGAKRIETAGSWSLFDGKFARQNAYLVDKDSTLLCCGAGGKVYTFDVDGTYDDDGETYKTEYQTGFLQIGKESDISIKQINYIKPVFEPGANITYATKLESGFDAENTETVDGS